MNLRVCVCWPREGGSSVNAGRRVTGYIPHLAMISLCISDAHHPGILLNISSLEFLLYIWQQLVYVCVYPEKHTHTHTTGYCIIYRKAFFLCYSRDRVCFENRDAKKLSATTDENKNTVQFFYYFHSLGI